MVYRKVVLMFQTIGLTTRLVLRRPVFWFAVWSYRHVGAFWGRSIMEELQRPEPFDGSRLIFLLRSLWSATTSTGFAVNPPAHKLSVVDTPSANGIDPRGWSVTAITVLPVGPDAATEELPA